MAFLSGDSRNTRLAVVYRQVEHAPEARYFEVGRYLT
jgi:hypothetical protein